MISDELVRRLLDGLLANAGDHPTRVQLVPAATRLTGNLTVTVGEARSAIERLLPGGRAHPKYMQLCTEASGAEHGVDCALRALTDALVTAAMEAKDRVLAA